MNCAKCGKDMTNPEGTSIVGAEIRADFPDEDDPLREWVQKQMGKYELNKRYQFCYECWLDSLFGR